eukprot:m.1277652 g.1277652  ORF g.1277652 m.1277652 type:complete len:86 (+) comp24764_c0_seq34:1470-1727(+)
MVDNIDNMLLSNRPRTNAYVVGTSNTPSLQVLSSSPTCSGCLPFLSIHSVRKACVRCWCELGASLGTESVVTKMQFSSTRGSTTS